MSQRKRYTFEQLKARVKELSAWGSEGTTREEYTLLLEMIVDFAEAYKRMHEYEIATKLKITDDGLSANE